MLHEELLRWRKPRNDWDENGRNHERQIQKKKKKTGLTIWKDAQTQS
jgi:hypothetical protein